MCKYGIIGLTLGCRGVYGIIGLTLGCIGVYGIIGSTLGCGDVYGIIGLTTRVQRCVWYYRLNHEGAEVCMIL